VSSLIFTFDGGYTGPYDSIPGEVIPRAWYQPSDIIYGNEISAIPVPDSLSMFGAALIVLLGGGNKPRRKIAA
jgi:hypothetical protein